MQKTIKELDEIVSETELMAEEKTFEGYVMKRI